MSDQEGSTLTELILSIAVFLIILGAIMTIVQVAMHNQDRVAQRVSANQRARPVLTRIMDQLHSSCVAPGVAPIQPGSTGTSMTFLSKTGSDVSPTPDRRVLSHSGSALTEAIYPATGGSAPTWTFSGTPASNRTLLEGIDPPTAGSPPVAQPVFRYFAYASGQIAATPLPTPLSAADAARAVQVDVAFSTRSGSAAGSDPNSAITLSDSAVLRLQAAVEDSSEVNLPCA